MRGFAKSVVIIAVFAIITRAIGFIFRIFLSRILGAEMLGVYQMAISVFMVLLTVISSGLPLVISREVAKDKSGEKLFGITISGLIIGITSSVILCLAVLFGRAVFEFIFTDPKTAAILIALLPAVIASAVYSVLRAVWWGQKRFVLLGLTELTEQVARVVFFAVFLSFAFYFADLADLSARSFSAACAVSAAVVIIIFIKTVKLKKPNAKNLPVMGLLKSASPITGVRIVSGIAFPVISVLLPLRLVTSGWDSQAAVSHFGIIVGMMFPLLTVPSTLISAMATALVPELSGFTENKDLKKVRRQIKKSIDFTIFINFLFIPVFAALGAGLGRFLFNNTDSGIYLSRSAWAMLPMSLSQITGAVLNSLGKESVAMKNYFVGSTALFLSVWFFPGIIGADAVIVGLGLSATISSVLNTFAVKKFTLWHKSIGCLNLVCSYAAISVPVFAAGFFIHNILSAVSPLLALGAAGLLSVTVFAALAWVFGFIPARRIIPAA
jgi:stage V sporulation protein B